jgi:hypothetical protein
MKALW